MLNGKSKFENGVCSVQINRQLQVEVQGKKASSIASIDVVFESLDKQGNVLNIAEIAILQDEAPDFIREIAESGLIIGAFHNHWLFTNPLIMYLHVQSIEPPVQFAEKISKALSVLH
ncbi:DUF1259 domain-containing protein [Oceanobacillus indicireducens]|uniref:DUF1259 domain-containing protein n=1 Tax=Oceanobacillus indicireducens TaxID=1004261 RepID=UPI001E3CDCEF|nr:DUF1259 domain-containing protein [Oceanobacillus indicireducens]